MAKGASGWILGMRRIGLAGLLGGIIVFGCGRKEPSPAPTEPTSSGDAQAAATSGNQEAGERKTQAAAAGDVDSRLQQSFVEATIADPPADQRPPDVTMTQKSVGKLYTEVVRSWDQIRFTTPTGKRLAYRATLDTELGPIEISLRPDLAPNHVRGFVALARAGYYDGLVFERTIHEEIEGQKDKLDLIEAGCPLGTGEAGQGSIGYWLKPEFNSQAIHEEGTVGASHAEEADTAACKFYITLGKAPFMDGNYTVFGKVTQGLNIARKILSLPVCNDPEYPEGDRPAKPVVIRKLTIITEEVDKWPAN